MTNRLQKSIHQHNKKLDKLRKECAATGKKWEDPDFPAIPANWFPNNKTGASKIAQFKRIEDFGGKAAIFSEGIDQGDVKQGALGDCWFLSSLCVLAGHGPAQLKDLFVQVYPKEGIALFRFYKDGEWHFVIIDDKIPCNANGKPVFASCRDPNELWVPLIEKAYAKLHGNFESIESGSITDGLADLTGQGTEVLDVKKTPEFWNLLLNFVKEGYLMGCASQSKTAGVEEANSQGILALHAYGVLTAVEADGNKLLRIRNPWGRYEWTGKWSDGSKEWTPALQKKLNVVFEDDGTFWMEFNDFATQFNKLYILRALTDEVGVSWKRQDFVGAWKGETAGGCLNNPTWNKNPQILLRSPAETRVFVSIRQPDLRMVNHKTPVYKAIGFAALLKGDSSDKKKEKVIKTDLITMSPFFAGREISAEFIAKANVDYVIIPSFFDKGVESPFYLSLYTTCKEAYAEQLGVNEKGPMKDEVSDVSDEEEEETGGAEAETEAPKAEAAAPKPQAQPVHTSIVGAPQQQSAQKSLITLKSKWELGKTAGGCPVNFNWKISPQFILELPNQDKVSIKIKQLNKGADGKWMHIGFFVFQSETAKRKKINTTNIVYQSQFINTQESGAEVDLPAGAYNILCCTHKADLANDFELTVQASRTHISLHELTPENDWKVISVNGAWTPGSDGGCSNNKATWLNNPKFKLEIGVKSNIKLVVDAPEKVHSAIGFYVFGPAKAGKVVGDLVGMSEFTKSVRLEHVVVNKDFELDAGQYTVMPATFEAAHHTSFVLSVYSDHEQCKLTPQQ